MADDTRRWRLEAAATMILTEWFHRVTRSLERMQISPGFPVLLVYFSILLDNILLTVVVPVIPEFLVELHRTGVREPKAYHRNETLNKILNDHPLSIEGRSKAYLENIDPSLDTENGQVGTILSSKAFVQLIFNPFVSPIINHLGYELTMIIGVTFLLNSCTRQSFMMLLIPRALQGIASALINISGMSMMANMFRQEERRIGTIGFCLGGMATGVLIGYPFGSLFYQWFGKSTLFGFILLFIMVLLVAQLVAFNWSPTNAPTHYDSKTIHIITNPRVLFFIVIIGVSTVTMSLLESFLPIWLIKEVRPPKWKLGMVFIPDSLGYLVGTNIFNLLYISLERRWILIIMALCTIGVCSFMVPLITDLLYLSMPHFGIGFGIGAIDSAIMPMLAELVDEQFAAQYGYVYTASQTASSAAYAFGPLIGGTLLTHRYLTFASLMHSISVANLSLCFLAFWIRSSYNSFGRKKTLSPSSTSPSSSFGNDIFNHAIPLRSTAFAGAVDGEWPNYQRFD